MNVGAKFENIETMRLTIITSGTVAEFKILLQNIEKSYATPMSTFIESIRKQIEKAEKHVTEETVSTK